MACRCPQGHSGLLSLSDAPTTCWAQGPLLGHVRPVDPDWGSAWSGAQATIALNPPDVAVDSGLALRPGDGVGPLSQRLAGSRAPGFPLTPLLKPS